MNWLCICNINCFQPSNTIGNMHHHHCWARKSPKESLKAILDHICLKRDLHNRARYSRFAKTFGEIFVYVYWRELPFTQSYGIPFVPHFHIHANGRVSKKCECPNRTSHVNGTKRQHSYTNVSSNVLTNGDMSSELDCVNPVFDTRILLTRIRREHTSFEEANSERIVYIRVFDFSPRYSPRHSHECANVV